MKQAVVLLGLVACVAYPAASGVAQASAGNTYVGVKACGPCHKTEKSGNQLGLWEKSKHAQAYTALTTAQANDIAKSKGLAKPAAESPECLECHAITAKVAADSKMDPKDGVQCEACHGPGSGYRSLSVMKDRAKSIAGGMTAYKDKAAIEVQCRKCHNERSPTMKGFKYDESWAKIAHPTPKTP